MIVILSAQYVGESLRAEVGDLPVSFVPLANRRLYAYQVETLRQAFPARPIPPVRQGLVREEARFPPSNDAQPQTRG